MPDQVLQQIKDRLNISDVIAGYIPIKKAGVNFKAVCPFHNEKSPSLVISPQKQIWHCFGCFPPGQMVKTPFGLHNIESMDERHYVYSGRGKIRRVLATHKRQYSGNLVSVELRKLGGLISMTADHHLRILRPKTKYEKKNKQFYKQCRADLKKGKFLNATEAAQNHGNLLEIAAGELQLGDFVLYPINTQTVNLHRINLKNYLNKSYTYGPRPAKVNYLQTINADLLKLIGYYIAEGSSHRAYIRFSLGNHEEAFAQEIVNLIKRLFDLNAKIYRRKTTEKKTGLEITACHANLANIFENLCGKGADKKHVPFIFQELPAKNQKILVEAVHKEDGHSYIAEKSKKTHKSITTVSRILAEQLVDLLLRNNFHPSFGIEKEHIDKKAVHHKEAYKVIWSEQALAQHELRFTDTDNSKYWLLPIKRIKKNLYKGPVYNLTVEKDHSYVATNFAVANCGEGGDVFGFVMKYENVEFKDALKLLADKAGVVLPAYHPRDEKEVNEEEQLYRINDFASRYYHEILLKDKRGTAALEYLKNRGLTEGTIKQWQIGFAPDDFHALERALLAKKVNLNEAIKAGVIAKNDRGQMFDRFRGRVTFPIFNYFGMIVGFSARILNDDGKSAKYINSPETIIYNKSSVLFGLNFAKDQIRKKDEMVIVEGQMDCISPHQAGFKNVVASSGTAYNQNAVALTSARRLTKNIKLCFDSDSAGQIALRKTGELLLKSGFLVKVISIKPAKDPDELVKKSPGLWEKAVAEAVWFLDHYISLAQEHNPDDPVSQIHYLNEQVLPLLNFIQDPLEFDHYIHQVSLKFPISEQAVRTKLKNLRVDHSAQKLPLSPPTGSLPALLLEKEVLGGLLLDAEFLSRVKDQLELSDFEHAEIQQEVKQALDSGQIQSHGVLAKEARFMVESQLEELDGNQTLLSRELLKAFALLKMSAIKKLQQHLQTEIKMAEIANNKTKIQELSQKFAQVSAQRMKFETFL